MSFTIVSQVLKKYTGDEKVVVIPDGVREIADYAFYGAFSMEEISIPESVTLMGNNVFYDCESLKKVVMPDSITYIGSGLFARCKNLESVVLSNGLTTLSKITFFQCESLTDIHFPRKLIRISRACFQQCHSLKQVVLPETVKILEENVFDDCTHLKKAALPSGLEVIGENAFFNCSSLQELIIPDSIKEVGKGAFETRGKIRITAPEHFFISSRMFDNNWNMNWNFGANGRYNGKNEDNYQLVDSYLVNVDFKEWKPEARCILCVNYLESYEKSASMYDQWIERNTSSLLERILKEERYTALHKGRELGFFTHEDILPYLHLISDPTQRALLMDNKEETDDSFDDLMNML